MQPAHTTAPLVAISLPCLFYAIHDMAFTALRQLKLPLEVTERIENSLLELYQKAFIKRYGRGMPCREMTSARGNHVGTIDCMPSPPGYRLYGFSFWDHSRLAIGMQFLLMNRISLGAYTVQKKTNEGLTVTGCSGFMNKTETFMAFDTLRQVILFVSSPGEYMLFVGIDRYTGDLSDLRPIAEGEEMSELEMDIRQAALERAQERDYQSDGDQTNSPGWSSDPD